MSDHDTGTMPCVALVYGQDSAIAHVRDAIEGKVRIAYAAAASEFDVARMLESGASAALVILDDDGDWLGGIGARLHEAGVAVVYNDPEISRGLEGWERARWLRHLVAKLRGSHDVDPPRPEREAPEIANANTATDAAPPHAAVPPVGLPLSSEEIETMSIDLAAEPASAPLPQPHAAAPADVLAMDLAVEEAAASASKVPAAETPAAADAHVHALPAAAPETDFDTVGGLDVDTEALSAMIDARLAEPDASMSADSAQVWRVVDGENVAPATAADAPAAPAASLDTAAAAPAAPSATEDDADVLASLPSLDDWQLIDHDAPVAADATRERPAAEPVLPDSFAGLELVPMETIVPLKLDTDPIERWLDDSAAAKQQGAAGAKS